MLFRSKAEVLLDSEGKEKKGKGKGLVGIDNRMEVVLKRTRMGTLVLAAVLIYMC